MPTYKAFDPQSEMTGRSVLSMITNILHEDIAEILTRHNLNNINPDAWYRLEDLLGVFNDVASGDANASSIFVSIGMSAADLGIKALTPEMKAMPVEKFLAAYSERYKTLHHGDVGYVNFEKLDDKHFALITRTPYPDDMLYGVFYGYARQLKPSGKGFKVYYDPQVPHRDEGGDQTIIHVQILD